MARPKKETQIIQELVEEMVVKTEPVDINEMPLNTLGDYMRYNAEARRLKGGIYAWRWK
jgi:hypothetical protein